jgi:HK97 gp10 family phage protein
MIQVKVEGLAVLDKRLKALAEEFGPKAAASPVRFALRKNAKKLQLSAQQHVHVDTGTLKQNIITSAERKPQDGRIEMRVTVRAKARAYKSSSRTIRKGLVGLEYQHYGPLFYARFLEFGTSKMPAYPFLRPAWDELKGALPELIRADLAAAIDKTLARLRA